jgi:hypothetical protein
MRIPPPSAHIYNVQFTQAEDVKYLGLHLGRRLTWRKHIFTERKQLGMTLSKMHWLLGHNKQTNSVALSPRANYTY